jgi:hypothetical protein
MRVPRLSFMGIMKVDCILKTVSKTTTKAAEIVSKFDWGDALADAGILAGITFFTALSGIKLAEVQTTKAVTGAGISASLQFLTIIALKRKLIKQNGETP